MKTSQGDELEFVSHGRQLGLESGDGGIVQLLFPVERRRAVVSQHLVWKFRMHGFGELAGFLEVGCEVSHQMRST